MNEICDTLKEEQGKTYKVLLQKKNYFNEIATYLS